MEKLTEWHAYISLVFLHVFLRAAQKLFFSEKTRISDIKFSFSKIFMPDTTVITSNTLMYKNILSSQI